MATYLGLWLKVLGQLEVIAEEDISLQPLLLLAEITKTVSLTALPSALLQSQLLQLAHLLRNRNMQQACGRPIIAMIARAAE